MQYYRILIASFVIFSWMNLSVFAQVEDTGDNVGIGTPSGTPSGQLFGKLDVRGDNIFLSPSTGNLLPNFPNKFIGVGQSGGSCDLWGFRAQLKSGSAGNFINMGVQRDVSSVSNPFISWGGCVVPRLAEKDPVLQGPDPVPVPFCTNRNLDFKFDNSTGGCGTLIAQMSRNTYKLTVFGRARFNSSILVNTTFYNSDRRFKRNINGISGALDIIKSIQGRTYEFKTEKFPERDFSDKLQYGFIAQELMEVAPNIVNKEEDGYYSVDYVALVPVLVEAVKEQSDQVTQLEATVNQQQEDIEFLKAELARLAIQVDNTGRTGNQTMESPVLFQNAPNPFQEMTTLRAFIPQEVQNARIMVYDLQGKLIQTKAIEQRGMTEASISGSSLPAGTYLYTLVADGNTIDTKRMTLTN